MHAESLVCKVEPDHYSQLGKTLSTDGIVRHHLETSELTLPIWVRTSLVNVAW